jgi:hypothetical protein
MKTIRAKLIVGFYEHEEQEDFYFDADTRDSEIDEAVRQWVKDGVDWEWQSIG